ncbi:hypothetical protein [Dyella japonica]|uniref:Uncharacterized protein n=1 Tax=Dyella japonica TaxID=231455 RepID=A0ABV2JUJ2_9GAMM
MDAKARQRRRAQNAARIISAIQPAQGQLTKAQDELALMYTPPGVAMALLRAGAEMERAIRMAERAMHRASRKALRGEPSAAATHHTGESL